MPTLTATPSAPLLKPKKRENFPSSSFSHINQRLHGLRLVVSKRAIVIAREAAPSTAEVFTVTPEHLDQALFEILAKPDELRKALDL